MSRSWKETVGQLVRRPTFPSHVSLLEGDSWAGSQTPMPCSWKVFRPQFNSTHPTVCPVADVSRIPPLSCVDEFSRASFVIPMNLRNPTARGFPPSDDEVYHFFEPKLLRGMSPDVLRVHVTAFILALFEECKKAIATVMEDERLRDNDPREWLRNKGAAWFRDKMTEGQTIASQGEYRVNFYKSVVARAQQIVLAKGGYSGLMVKEKESSPEPIKFASAGELSVVDTANTLIQLWDVKDKSPRKGEPLLYMAFDEAHTLMGPDDVASAFTHLRKILRSVRQFPLFAIFLSTTAQIPQFVPPKEDDSSARVQSGELSVIPPFCTLGWDQCAAPFPDPMTLSQ
ncbi:hypothetical protein EUX98_g8375, partial [Antrodiella citrinella]